MKLQILLTASIFLSFLALVLPEITMAEKPMSLDSAIAQFPESKVNSAEAHFNRGVVYYNQGKYDLAIANFGRTIKINPNNANAYYNRAIVYAKKEKYDLAQTDFENAKQIFTVRGNIDLVEKIDNILQQLP